MNITPIVKELETERDRLDAAIKALRAMRVNHHFSPTKQSNVRPITTIRRTMSAAAKRKIAAAQRARWAKWRKLHR